MIDNKDQLRAAMQAHEHLAPDPAAVYSRVQELAKSYRRRRVIMQSAGGAVLGAGLIAGAIQLPGLLPGETAPSGGAGLVQPAAPQSSAPPLLKIKPTPGAPAPARPGASAPASAGALAPGGAPAEDYEEPSPQEQRALDAYFEAGYNFDDAVKLAKIWKLKDISEVKATAGQRLLDGKKVPIEPSGSGESHQSEAESNQVGAFFAEGYDYNDAVQLAKIWKLKTPYDAKIAGGEKILAGETLPIRP